MSIGGRCIIWREGGRVGVLGVRCDWLAERFLQGSSSGYTSSIHVEVDTLLVQATVQRIFVGREEWALQGEAHQRRFRPISSELYERRMGRDGVLCAKAVYPDLLRRKNCRTLSGLTRVRARGRKRIGEYIIRAGPSSGSYDTDHVLVA